MIYVEEFDRVADAIRKGPHAGVTYRLWLLCLTNAEYESCLVKLDRDELAERTGIAAQHVSRSMKLLDDYGAVFTRKRKGRVIYECSPLVGVPGPMTELERHAHWIRDEVVKRADTAKQQRNLGV